MLTIHRKIKRCDFHLLAFCILLLWQCSSKSGSEKKTSSTKFKQYYVKGEQLYVKHCSNCHQKNGTGLGLLYPPLNKSDYMENNFEQVICIIKNGLKGEVTVNGKEFNKEMPGIPSLSDLEIAEISTYIYNTWENQKGIVEAKSVSAILDKCDGKD